MSKINLSIDDELRTQMESLDRKPNWSGIAAAAFRQHIAATNMKKTEIDMSDVIERMKAAQELDAAQNSEIGRQEGRVWAAECASPRKLKRLEADRDPVHDWYIGVGESAYAGGDLIARVLNGTETPEQGAFKDMISPEYSDLEDVPEFVQGFAEGCMEIWEEVRDQL